MTMPARYSGICPECGERWQPGDLIRGETAPMTRGVIYRHAVCPDPVEEAEGSVCDRCFLRRSLTGECGCDE